MLFCAILYCLNTVLYFLCCFCTVFILLCSAFCAKNGEFHRFLEAFDKAGLLSEQRKSLLVSTSCSIENSTIYAAISIEIRYAIPDHD